MINKVKYFDQLKRIAIGMASMGHSPISIDDPEVIRRFYERNPKSNWPSDIELTEQWSSGQTSMSFSNASGCIMSYGKYYGKTLEQIGNIKGGLKYLKWLHDERERNNNGTVLDIAMSVYLRNGAITKELVKLGLQKEMNEAELDEEEDELDSCRFTDAESIRDKI